MNRIRTAVPSNAAANSTPLLAGISSRVITVMLLSTALAATPASARERDGYIGKHPDLSGTYNIATLTPLQRPKAFGDNLLLTKEQADYIDVPVDGPYKPEHYRY